MPGCAVAQCRNSEKNCKGRGITFHRIPKDDALRKAWIHACKRADTFNVANAKVCSLHFNDDDFERDLKSELLNIKPKKQLKSGAIPRFNIPTISNKSGNSERSDRNKKREINETLKKDIDGSYGNQQKKSPVNVNGDGEFSTNSNVNKPDSFEHSNLSSDTEISNCPIKETNSLKKENLLLKEQIKCALQELASVQQENVALKSSLSKFRNIFSENQVQLIEKGSCSSWSSDDISKAVTLRSISKKSFDFVRNHLKYPLPSERTIKRRLSKIEVSPGFIEISLDLLKSHANVFTEPERDVIISYDEMKIKSDVCYDSVQDVLLGPHNYVQVIVVRCLMGKWKQPIFYDFDRPMDKSLFNDVVTKIEETGFKVRGFVGDMGPSNQKLLSELGININQTSIVNPTDDKRKIWGFCDVPHMLKLMRNHLLDEGYKLSDGKIVRRDILEQLVSAQKHDLKFAHKVTPNHFLVQGTERQNVRKAAELLSGTMALAVGYLYDDQEHIKWFLETVNNGFDVLNSRIPNHPNKLKSGYGMHLDEQNDALTKLYDLCSTSRVLGKNYLLPFQKGFLISISSMTGLFTDLQSEGYSYLMTSRCNQDVLESYFSMIRGFGKFYDHPLPTTVSQRIKSLLLSCNASSIIKTGNCSNEDDSVTLSVNLINNAVNEVEESPSLSNTSMSYSPTEVTDEDDDLKELSSDDFQTVEVECDERHIEENSDLLKMLAGYVAYRVKKKKLVSTFVYGHPTNECPSNQRDWLSTLSKGFLMNPTEEWLEVVEQMERDFLRYHGDSGLNKEKGVMKILTDKLKNKLPSVDEFAISCYVRTRTFIRMKSINKKKSVKRSYGNKSTDAGRKKSKKFNKLQ